MDAKKVHFPKVLAKPWHTSAQIVPVLFSLGLAWLHSVSAKHCYHPCNCFIGFSKKSFKKKKNWYKPLCSSRGWILLSNNNVLCLIIKTMSKRGGQLCMCTVAAQLRTHGEDSIVIGIDTGFFFWVGMSAYERIVVLTWMSFPPGLAALLEGTTCKRGLAPPFCSSIHSRGGQILAYQ